MVEALARDESAFYDKARKEIHRLEQVNLCEMHAMKVNFYLTQIEKGISALLKHEFPMTLVDFYALGNHMPELSQALAANGIRLVYNTVEELLQTKTSYGVVGTLLHIFIHIPISSTEEFMAYEYVPTPSIMPKDSSFHVTEIKPDNSILICNPSRTLFIERSTLTDCTEVTTDRFLCPDSNVIRSDTDQSCLMSLFTHDEHNTLTLCPSAAFPYPFYARQLTNNLFFFFAATQRTGTVKCAGVSSTIFRTTHSIPDGGSSLYTSG